MEEKKKISKKISGGLKQAINAHGPITKELIGSATKRIYGNLQQNPNEVKVDSRYSLRDILIGIGIGLISGVGLMLIIL